AKPVGEELWQAGVSVLDDVLTHKSDFKKSLETRLKESGHRLKRKAEYIDLPHTLLKIRAKIVDKNGAAAPATDAVGPVNLTLHSLFQKVDVLFNQKLVSASNSTYPYRAYIETILRMQQI
ncbi:hypothetical protein HCN44_011489, partial [Aphidius gifuensis]